MKWNKWIRGSRFLTKVAGLGMQLYQNRAGLLVMSGRLINIQVELK